MQERRQYPRINIDYVTVEVYSSIKEINPSEIEEICPVVNISENGMRFKADQNFSKGQVLRLTFVLPQSVVVIRTDALIVYVSKSGRNATEIGVQFSNLGLAEHRLIQHFINKNLQQPA